KRPQTARDLSLLLSRSPLATAWSIEEADAWWGRHERGQAGVASAVKAFARSTDPGGHGETIDLTTGRS
ncbi:MAG TPA: hypothetical protein VF175_15010, partial [Lacipirellula sp.]